VRLFFKDNGIGIEPEHQEKIFGLFQRLHDNDTYPGTGLGLAIVRKGIERLGGTAGLRSGPGRGSTFWIELQDANCQSEVEAMSDAQLLRS
jgi:signal transduction histidine kinase